MMCLVCRKRPIHARGRCSPCYRMARRDKTIETRPHGAQPLCACGVAAIARGYCHRCYQRQWREERHGR